jgi:hypothetical protein
VSPALSEGSPSLPSPGSRQDAEAVYAAACERGNLTRRQLFVWAGGRVATGRSVFTEGALLHLYGRLDVPRFARAWQAVVDESDALRSVVTLENGWPKRTVAPCVASPVELVDLTGVASPAVALEDLARERFERCGQAGGPLVDVVMARLAPEHHVWILIQHQLISDSWSFRVVHARTDAHYRQGASLVTDPEAVPPFATYVDYERRVWSSERRAAAEQHWRRCYQGPSGRSDHPAVCAGAEATRISRVVRRLGRTRSLALRRLGAEIAPADVGLFVVCASAAAAYVHCTTSARDVVLAVPFANRPSERFKRTIGSFMNVSPVRVGVEGSDCFRDVLVRVASATWEAARHQWYAARPGAVPQPYDVLVNVHRSVVGAHTFGDLPMDVAALVPTHRFGGVLIAVHDFGDTGELSLVLDFNQGIFPASEREPFAEGLLRLVDAALAEPGRRLNIPDGASEARETLGERQSESDPVPEARGTEIERAIASVWRALLGVDHVDPDADFFALGGDSLLAYRMLLQVGGALHVALAIGDFLTRPTVAGLARTIVATAPTARTDADLEGLLYEVEALSDAEAGAMLADAHARRDA